jgi:hypothetical protein
VKSFIGLGIDTMKNRKEVKQTDTGAICSICLSGLQRSCKTFVNRRVRGSSDRIAEPLFLLHLTHRRSGRYSSDRRESPSVIMEVPLA